MSSSGLGPLRPHRCGILFPSPNSTPTYYHNKYNLPLIITSSYNMLKSLGLSQATHLHWAALTLTLIAASIYPTFIPTS